MQVLPDGEIPGIFNALSLSLLTLLVISVIVIGVLVIYLVRKASKNRTETEQSLEIQPTAEQSPVNQPSSAAATGYSELQLNEVSKTQYETCRVQAAAGDQEYEAVDELSPGNQSTSAMSAATGYSELQLNEVSKTQYETCRVQSTATDDQEYDTPPDAEGVIDSGLYEVPISDE